jgi:ATP-dependent DNA helicase PIF1
MDEERLIYEAFTSRKNMILHGPAGTGKSYAINGLIKSLRQYKDEDTDCVYVVAPTGQAANNIGGTTIHYSFGLGLVHTDMKYANVIPNYDFFEDKERKGLELKYHLLISEYVKKASFRDKNLEYLFIDEISMVGGTILIILDAILRNRIPGGSAKPMGGIQCIFSGDFYQLPPVKDGYCFNTKVWKSLALTVIPMLTCRRFGADTRYFSLVLNLRRGELTDSDKAILLERKRAYSENEHLFMEVPPLELYPYNKDIDSINRRMLNLINDTEYVFEAIDTKEINERFIRTPYDRQKSEREMDRMLDDSMKKSFVVRPGSQVILVHNYSVGEGLSNGRMCKIISINRVDGEQEPRKNIITVKNPAEYTITVITNEGATHIINPITTKSDHRKFHCSRLQFPFMLAWAVTCHRSQGKTLESAIVDVGSSFTDGQSYVALSRVTELNKLFISGLNFNKITANAEVKALFD